jgi:hypothetical protein
VESLRREIEETYDRVESFLRPALWVGPASSVVSFAARRPPGLFTLGELFRAEFFRKSFGSSQVWV